MSPKPTVSWYGHDHADAYLLASVVALARGASRPVTRPLPPPSVAATLYCAFAAEAYVNVALVRTLGETEYVPASRMPVRTKYYVATRLGMGEQWFTTGEPVLEHLDELFTQRNRLVHAQPERSILHPFADPQSPDLHNDLSNVARWILATAECVSRLSRSHAELAEFDRVAGRLLELEQILRDIDAVDNAARLEMAVKDLLAQLLRDDEQDLLPQTELDELLEAQDPDWDVPGFPD
jgi:hypothetical protein